MWAYGLDWVPPVIPQDYVGCTTELDEAASQFLSSPAGPERILRQTPQAIDGELWSFEAPSLQMSILCHYRQLVVTGEWEVLGKVPRPVLCTASVVYRPCAAYQQDVSVPTAGPGEIVYADFNGGPCRGGGRWRRCCSDRPVSASSSTVRGVTARPRHGRRSTCSSSADHARLLGRVLSARDHLVQTSGRWPRARGPGSHYGFLLRGGCQLNQPTGRAG